MSPKDSEKITSAYNAERSRLLGYIRNRVSDKIDAEDILQDVFYQLTVGFNDIRRIESLTGWLYRVADNRVTDRFRKKRPLLLDFADNAKDSEEGLLRLEEILPAIGSSHEEEEIKDIIWDTIEETLDELPEEQRFVFIQNEFEEKSFKEISEETGVGINTLISRKRYAVLALRERLEKLYKLLINK